MEEKEFLEKLGFEENPFQFTNADEEEHLQSYFVPPPYFPSVWGNPQTPKSHVIFAPRGGGKSAQRRMIEHRAENADVLAVTYDRFEGIEREKLQKLGVEYHLRNIIKLILFGFLLEYKSRQIPASAFSRAEREQIAGLCRLYVEKITRSEALAALKSLKTLSTRAREFFHQWAGPLNTLTSTILASMGTSMTPQLGHSPSHGVTEKPSKGHLEIVRDLLGSVGFKSIYVLVDKVDETSMTGNNAEASFLLMKPLLRDLDLLQLKNIGFKFFLWDKLEPHYARYARPDRVEQFELSWSEGDINKMLERRLEAFSNGKVADLGKLTDADLARPLQTLVVVFAAGSPRDMIRICQDILSEQLQVAGDAEKIGVDAIIQGITKFCTRRARELVKPQILQELTKTGRLTFTTNYVANDVFKIEVNSARNKISQWKKTGAVDRAGQLSTGGRPIFQYAITDVRLAKAILPHVSLVDFGKKKLRTCLKCSTAMARDWDLNPTQTCHECGEESTFQANNNY